MSCILPDADSEDRRSRRNKMPGPIDVLKLLSREFYELDRFFLPENKNSRRLVFYAESAVYKRYYEDYMAYVLQNSDLDIAYLTSDPQDDVLKSNEPRIRPFYIRHLLSALIAKLDSAAIVMTAPDLGNGPIKKARGVHHIYAFHALSSTHQYYRPHAFDHFDSILCTGEYQIKELEETERVYGSPPKNLILTGYPFIESLYREHQALKNDQQTSKADSPLCLIAPSWWWISPSSSILESCLEPMLDALLKSNWRVCLRPHPEYLKRYRKRIDTIEKRFFRHSDRLSLQTNLSSRQIIHQADVLITDHSTIAMDFALGIERPVLFIDTPLHVGNPDWQKISMPPIENTYRNELGSRLRPDQMQSLVQALDSLRENTDRFREKVGDIRNQLIANWQSAAKIGGDYIIKVAQG